MRLIPCLLICISIAVGGCASSYAVRRNPTVLDAGFAAQVRPKIALLPPRFSLGTVGGVEIGSELALGRLIVQRLKTNASQEWLAPEETVSAIQDANALPDYEALLDGFQKTGIASKTRLAKIGEAVKAPYIALCNLRYNQYEKPGWLGTFRSAQMTIQVLSITTGTVVFEGIGTGETGPGYGTRDEGTEYVFRVAADEIIGQFPGSTGSQ